LYERSRVCRPSTLETCVCADRRGETLAPGVQSMTFAFVPAAMKTTSAAVEIRKRYGWRGRTFTHHIGRNGNLAPCNIIVVPSRVAAADRWLDPGQMVLWSDLGREGLIACMSTAISLRLNRRPELHLMLKVRRR